VGEPDWLKESTKSVEIVAGSISRPESTSSSGYSTASLPDVFSSHDTSTDPEHPQGQTAESSLPLDVPDKTILLCLNTMRGVIGRRSSEEKIKLPERKRPMSKDVILRL
jgi:hypothetical protein